MPVKDHVFDKNRDQCSTLSNNNLRVEIIMTQSRIILTSPQNAPLDTVQLAELEKSFRQWAEHPSRHQGGAAGIRILIIFLLIRYTGAKLKEVLVLDPRTDVNLLQKTVTFHGSGTQAETRVVHISEPLAQELEKLLPRLENHSGKFFDVDQAYVRRKFYERAEECGFSRKQGGPEMIRKARAVELMQNNLPLPAVQRLLGYSSPHSATAHISFSEQDMLEVARLYMEKEAGRKTSARNSFFGKVRELIKGDVQTMVVLVTPDGEPVSTMITNTSVERLGLKPGRLVTAEIKSPWVVLEHYNRPGVSSMENSREGRIVRITRGKVNTECAVRIGDGAELCAIVSTPGFTRLDLKEGDHVRLLFSAYAVILHTE